MPRSIIPQPNSASIPGAPISTVVVFSTEATCAPVMYGKRSISTAMLPATCGAAIEVPLYLA
ncbi:hypothetical protein D3C71_2212830 [compost metagenome]